MSIENSKACYVPLNHITKDCVQINQKSFVEIIKKFLRINPFEDGRYKFDYNLEKFGINLKLDDAMLCLMFCEVD